MWKASETSSTAVQTGYAPVNGLKMYYEIHGTGQPLVLLHVHGAFSAIGTSFGTLVPGLAQSRQVIGFELQAHGRTADIDRPMSLEQMADDVAAAIRYLRLERADVFGYSMGAGGKRDDQAGGIHHRTVTGGNPPGPRNDRGQTRTGPATAERLACLRQDQRDPETVIHRAVAGPLPKNRLAAH